MASRKSCCSVHGTETSRGCCSPRNTAKALGDILLTQDKLQEIIRRAKEWALLYGKINPFSYTTILQQTTLNIFCQKMENLYN